MLVGCFFDNLNARWLILQCANICFSPKMYTLFYNHYCVSVYLFVTHKFVNFVVIQFLDGFQCVSGPSHPKQGFLVVITSILDQLCNLGLFFYCQNETFRIIFLDFRLRHCVQKTQKPILACSKNIYQQFKCVHVKQCTLRDLLCFQGKRTFFIIP